MAKHVNHYKGCPSRFRFNINNHSFAPVSPDTKQSGGGVKGKEAEVAKERSQAANQEKSMLKGSRQTTAKALQNSLKYIDSNILVVDS